MIAPEGKRRPLSVMIGLMAKKPRPVADHEEPDGDEGDEDGEAAPDEELQACQDVIDAMQKRSPRALSQALHSWMELAGYGRHGEEE